MPMTEGVDKSKISLGTRKGRSSRVDYGLAWLKRTWRTEGGGLVAVRPTLNKLLLMWREPALTLALTYKFVPVLNARRRWTCADREKARFFKTLFDPILEETVLHMLTSYVTRFAGLSFSYKLGETSMAGWESSLSPIVFQGVRVLSPETIKVEYDKDADRFLGIRQSGELIPADYSLWYTHAAYRVFGNLYGWSDLEPADRSWFTKYLAYALFDRHIEDRVIPPLEVGYPSQLPEGSTMVTDPDTGETMSLGQLARALGEDVRAGDVMAMPTDRWETALGEQTDVPLWHLKYHEVPDSISSLKQVFDIADAEMFRSVHIPPSILLRMGEGWQSGKSVENLVQVLYDAALMDVKELDVHVNILAERLDRWNYPADSPPCRIQTVGLSTKDAEALRQIAVVLANRPGGGGLDDAMDAHRFWEELGVPVREEFSVGVEEGEGLEASPVVVTHAATDAPASGEKVRAKFRLFHDLVREELVALDELLGRFQLDLSEEKMRAVEAITDAEWDNAATQLFAAGRMVLYVPADLRALEAQMSPVQRLVFYRSVWDATDAAELADQVYASSLRAGGAEMTHLAGRLWGRDERIDLTDPVLLAELRAQAWGAAHGVALTHNVDLARQIMRIGRDVPTANRYVYAARLRIWETGRSIWKSAQVALAETSRAIESVLRRFLRRNEGVEGKFEVVPTDWAEPECRFDCRGAVEGGPYPLSEWDGVGPFPLHPNCPHRKVMIVGSLTNLPNVEEAWLG